MFGEKQYDLTETPAGNKKYMMYGNQLAMITGYTIKKSNNGEAFKIILNMETPQVTADGFTADDGAVRGGKVGRVGVTAMYINPTKEAAKPEGKRATDEFQKKFQVIASKISAESLKEVLNIGRCATIEEYMEKIINIISGKDLYFQVCASEYDKGDGKTGFTLHLGKFGYVASIAEGLNHLKPFDKENRFHFEPVKTSEVPADNASTAKSDW